MKLMEGYTQICVMWAKSSLAIFWLCEHCGVETLAIYAMFSPELTVLTFVLAHDFLETH